MCGVEFCREDCQILEEGNEIFRASGLCICEICGKDYYHHQKYVVGSGHVIKSCEGVYYHL